MSNTALVEEFIAAWNRLDMQAIEDMLTDDVFYHNIPMEPCRGKEQFRAFMAQMPATAAEWTTHAIAESGNKVLTERTDRLEIGGKWVSIRLMGIFEIENGKIAQWRDYFDLAEFTAQLG